MNSVSGGPGSSRIPGPKEIARIRPDLQQGAMTGLAAGLALARMVVWALIHIWPS